VGWSAPGDPEGAGRILDDLAVVRLGGPTELTDAVTALTRTGGDGMVVAVLGEAPHDDVRALATLARGAKGVAILLRTSQWSGGLPEKRIGKLDDLREQNMRTLRAAGWAVAEAGANDSVPDVWARATGAIAPHGRPRMVVLPHGGDS
jgi:hypothetical protein